MTKRSSYCDECRHYSTKHLDDLRTPCSIGHRPRFYIPKTMSQAHSDCWGWKRRCEDFSQKGVQP
jgi:hypothetical protein